MPCTELKQRFPNLYMEPMQMDNSEIKAMTLFLTCSLTLAINLTIYIGKNTQWHTSKVKMQAVSI